jgi:hypothetical protein
MAGAGGVGARGVRGVGAIGQDQPPRIFSKVISRYDPLVLLVVLHDLPENYMNIIPKFMGEWDLTTTKHTTFFD